MKVYIVGCYIPYNSENEIISILENLFHEGSHGYIAPIYAWSKKKSTAKLFLETHDSKLLSIRVKEFDSQEEFDDFEKYNRTLEIRYIEYSASVLYSVKILSTDWERRMVRNTMMESSESYVYDTLTVDYTIFKQKYVNALDFISYTTLYDIYVGGDEKFVESEHEIGERQDTASHNSSYNLTVFGNSLELITELEFFHYCKLFMYFINPARLGDLIQ